jgi:acetyl esterase
VPTFDPEVEKLIEAGRQAGRPSYEALTPEEARAFYAASWDVLQPPPVDVASTRDLTVPRQDGALRLRVYRGLGTQATERLPCLVFCMVADG